MNGNTIATPTKMKISDLVALAACHTVEPVDHDVGVQAVREADRTAITKISTAAREHHPAVTRRDDPVGARWSMEGGPRRNASGRTPPESAGGR